MLESDRKYLEAIALLGKYKTKYDDFRILYARIAIIRDSDMPMDVALEKLDDYLQERICFLRSVLPAEILDGVDNLEALAMGCMRKETSEAIIKFLRENPYPKEGYESLLDTFSQKKYDKKRKSR